MANYCDKGTLVAAVDILVQRCPPDVSPCARYRPLTVCLPVCRFSGIKESDMSGVTVTIRDVQAVLLSMFSSKTILIGHSLESDFKALKVTDRHGLAAEMSSF